MALDMDVIGKKIGPLKKDYDWKDAVLYAIGVGAGFDELDYTYEKNLKVIPSFSIAAIFNFLDRAAVASNLNLTGVLHGEQDLIFHNPIPASGTLTTEGKITHYYDKGPKGALVMAESDTIHSNGKKLFTNIGTLFARFDGGFGGENAPTNVINFPERPPDFSVDAVPSPNQPLVYRLSGDIFPLHVDPEFAKMAGFERPIMHGLCTHGFACRALMAGLTPGRPELVRRLACRFSRTLYPGDPIRTLIWKVAEGKAVWRTINTRNGETVIDNGVFEYGEVPNDEIRFDGRVAVITGAGGGLGRVYALELAKRGAKIVVNDFGGARDGAGEGSATPARKVVEEIEALGGEAVANYDNVATPEGGERIVKSALDAFGTVDILINNAGIIRDKSILKMEPETWNAVLDVHLQGAYHVTKPVFAVMKEKGYGRIIMTASAAGLYGNFGQTNYGSAKMALVGFMNTLKLEGAKYDIKVNTVAPVAASRLMADIIPPEIIEKMKPEFVAPLVLFLSSEKCPVTGRIYNAGVGFYNRAAVMTSPGTVIGDGKKVPTVEEVGAAWEKIMSLQGAKELGQMNDLMGDMLAVSVDPPAIYGMIQFEGGGRFMADFTDCELADCKVGLPVKMVFRRRFTDDERGFSGYFWKAAPQPGAAAVLPAIRFDGRVAIVTGAGAGLGRTYALELAKRGAKVVVNDFGGARDGAGAGSGFFADKVVAEIRAAGGEAVANYDNVATSEGGERIVRTAVEFFGGADILINNAGIIRDKSFLKMEPENWNAVLAVHLNGAYNVTRPVFAVMREKGYGRIVMTTSAAGLYGNFGQTNYSSAKMGLVGFMNTLKLEGAKYNIRVNTIAPVAASRLTEDVMPSDMFQRMQPDFVAGIVLYLCSEVCAESGDIFNAAAGFYSRAAILTGTGAVLSDGKAIPTPEEIRDHWEEINSLEGAGEIGDANTAIISFLTPPAPKAEAAGGGAADVKGIFAKMPEVFNAAAAAGKDVVFQFSISGPGGGDWVVAVKDGTCRVEAGKAEKPTTTIKMADGDFLLLIAGKLDGMQAYSSGKLKVEGDILKSQLIGRFFKFGK